MNKIVILAGGAGSRLWPFSRQKYPKQILKLIGENSLLQETCLRFEGSLAEQIHVVTNRSQKFLIEQNLDEIGISHENLVIEEPYARNTAAAICLAALQLDSDDIMIVLPSDHIIPDKEAFNDVINEAVELAQQNRLITLGIKPIYPETGYGYIKRGQSLSKNSYNVDSFKEKPALETAKDYLKSDQYYWNSGMFVWKVESILEQFKLLQPKLFNSVKSYLETSDAQFFYDTENISIDYAILEKCHNVAVVEANFRWSDLGSWKSVFDIQDKDLDGNVINGQALVSGSKNVFVHNTSKDRTVAAVGLNNISIIDTDDAVVVCHNEKTQDVKQIVDQLKINNSDLVIYHKTVYRPWGYYKILEDAPNFKTKRLVVYPKQAISLQYHLKRNETWTVVKGLAEVICGDVTKVLSVGETIYIPAGKNHRISNNTDQPIEIIEVQTGEYFGEDDIVRLEDQYNRLGDK
jgi:mannose-1-phosphate guanylyltransferase/mannose-6-phosphate isomerase